MCHRIYPASGEGRELLSAPGGKQENMSAWGEETRLTTTLSQVCHSVPTKVTARWSEKGISLSTRALPL